MILLFSCKNDENIVELQLVLSQEDFALNATFLQYLIVCPLCMLAGFVDAIVGGGGLISLPAYLIAGFPVHLAVGTNRMNSAMGSTVAAIKYAKDGYVPWKRAMISLLFAIAGSYVGARIALYIDERYFLYLMLIILPLTGVYVIFHSLMMEEKESYATGITWILLIFFSFLIGMYDGFYGPGSGTFLLLLFTGVAHISLKEANGISKLIFMVTNLTAFLVFFGEGQTLIPLGFTAGIFSMAGNYLGARYFRVAKEKVLKGLILTVLSIFMIKVILSLL